MLQDLRSFFITIYTYLFEFIIKIKSNEDLTQIQFLTYVFGLFSIDLQLSHCIHLKHACLNENSHWFLFTEYLPRNSASNSNEWRYRKKKKVRGNLIGNSSVKMVGEGCAKTTKLSICYLLGCFDIGLRSDIRFQYQ